MGQKNSREGEFSPEGDRGHHPHYAGRKSVTSDKRKKPTHKRTGSMGNSTISRFSDLTGIQLNNNMVGKLFWLPKSVVLNGVQLEDNPDERDYFTICP